MPEELGVNPRLIAQGGKGGSVSLKIEAIDQELKDQVQDIHNIISKSRENNKNSIDTAILEDFVKKFETWRDDIFSNTASGIRFVVERVERLAIEKHGLQQQYDTLEDDLRKKTEECEALEKTKSDVEATQVKIDEIQKSLNPETLQAQRSEVQSKSVALEVALNKALLASSEAHAARISENLMYQSVQAVRMTAYESNENVLKADKQHLEAKVKRLEQQVANLKDQNPGTFVIGQTKLAEGERRSFEGELKRLGDQKAELEQQRDEIGKKFAASEKSLQGAQEEWKENEEARNKDKESKTEEQRAEDEEARSVEERWLNIKKKKHQENIDAKAKLENEYRIASSNYERCNEQMKAEMQPSRHFSDGSTSPSTIPLSYWPTNDSRSTAPPSTYATSFDATYLAPSRICPSCKQPLPYAQQLDPG